MGQPGSSPNSSSSNSIKPFITISEMNDSIDKFCTSEIDRDQFLNKIFPIIENKKHPLGKMKICSSYILQRLYLVNKNGYVSCSELKNRFYKMLNDPQKAIQLSFQLIDLDNDKYITNAEFLNFIDNSFINLMFTVQNSIADTNFKIQLKQWVQNNKNKLLQKIMEVFKNNVKSHPERWNYGDYKNWVVSGSNWTLEIEIGPQKYRTPLNLLCLLGMT